VDVVVVVVVVDGLQALHDQGLAQEADHADVIPDPGQRVSPRAEARVVPNHDQSPVHDPKAVAVTLAISPNPDHLARRRIPNLGLDHAPGQNPGIRVAPEVSAKNAATGTQEVARTVRTRTAIDCLTGHLKRMINWIASTTSLKKLFYFSFL